MIQHSLNIEHLCGSNSEPGNTLKSRGKRQHPNRWTVADSLISPKGNQAYTILLTTLHWAVTFDVPLTYLRFVKGEDGKQKVYHFIHADFVWKCGCDMISVRNNLLDISVSAWEHRVACLFSIPGCWDMLPCQTAFVFSHYLLVEWTSASPQWHRKP